MRSGLRREIWGYSLTVPAAALTILATIAIIAFLTWKGLSLFLVHKVPLSNVFSTAWHPERPAAEGGPQVGILNFFYGSVVVSVLATLLSTPFGVAVAVFISEIAPKVGQRVLQPVIELLAGIPSVVYGWIGLSVLVPFIRNHLGGTGFSLLAGVLVLSVMILPTITSVATDSLRSLSHILRETAYALGATRWQMIRLVLLPAARTGILTGVVLALARAFGEALAVQMVIGNIPNTPTSLLIPIITLTSGITMYMGNTVQGSLWNDALWFMGLILLVTSFFFIILVRYVGKWGVAK
ncbi:phosphate ABC transporter permease subunit PstC [Ammonifex thiophilus]|uniref:Phosphate transport system permease protein n=1 Tax=Ammonifex thiophilus TaxID=444093 RepID=A0A3D8P4J2_9THEO|nr:phosphate ABC transporter permease subunit PstC [Ammonifex thiophilus]